MMLKVKYLFLLILVLPLLLNAQVGAIKIGVLIPDSSQREIIDACALAITGPNSLRMRPGMYLKLVVRSMEGPWGAGSKATVDLIYQDSVVAMLCSLDGRNAHLAEQVSAKTQVACVETSATDPTLTQAYVPWYQRNIPSDDQQARAIIQEIEELGGGKTAIICTGEYDTRMTAHSFTKILAKSGSSAPVILNIGEGNASGRELADMIREKEIRHLVLSLNTASIKEMLPILREKMPGLNLFGTHAFAAAFSFGKADWHEYEGMYLVSTALPISKEGEIFNADFKEHYGYEPGITAAYAYDGIELIITAIQTRGRDPEAIRKYLTDIQFSDGLTGSISFDEMGNRKDAARIVRILKGKPVLND